MMPLSSPDWQGDSWLRRAGRVGGAACAGRLGPPWGPPLGQLRDAPVATADWRPPTGEIGQL